MAISQNFPTVRPTLSLNFARSKTLDPRITFERNSIGTYVDEDGLIETAGIDKARFDHDPATGESLGLLIEESRTNKLLYSEDFTAAGWGNVNVVKTADAAVAPDGTTTADEIYATTTNINQGLTNRSFSSFTQNVWHTFNVFWKPGTSSGVNLQLPWNDGGNAGVMVNFILSNGELTTSGVGGYGNQESSGYHIKKYPNGWWRVGITFRATGNPGGGNGQVWIYPSVQSNGLRGTNLTSYLWGAQLEEGGFPTSYIPTSGSTVTRSEDNASITGTNFSDFYNQDEGTVYVSQKLKAVQDTDRNNLVYLINGGSQNDYFYNVKKGHTNIFTFGDGGTNYSRFQDGTDSTDTKTTWAYDVSGDDFKAYYDGIEATNETTNNTPSATSHTQLELGSTANSASGTKYCGHIQQFIYYPTRLPNAQLQNLTK